MAITDVLQFLRKRLAEEQEQLDRMLGEQFGTYDVDATGRIDTTAWSIDESRNRIADLQVQIQMLEQIAPRGT